MLRSLPLLLAAGLVACALPKARPVTAVPTTRPARSSLNARPKALRSALRSAPRSAAPAQAATFRNPLKQDGADPWMGYYNGYYYLSSTTAVDVKLRRARRIGDLATAPDVQVWKDDAPGHFRDLWAPEFHMIDSGDGPRWYLYYTASDGQNGDSNHRMYVAQSAGADIMGPYTFKAQLQTDPDNSQYAIDGTVIKQADGKLYFAWCGRPSPTGQGLYISRMANPWTLQGERSYLPASGFGSNVVREGPEALQHSGQVFLFYSSSPADTPDYKLGMLIADARSDLSKPESWKQHPKIMFARVDQRGVFGPGHNFFFKSPDGREDWNAYHAKSGTAPTYADRSTRAQKITWGADGLPDLGLPVSTDADVPVPSGEPRQ